jgi:hypothetical protein
MDITPKVSVLLSVYNGAPYLREAIDSILQQSYTTFELLVVDDGSTDETPLILASYSDSRLQIIHNNKNFGLAISLNKGLDLACGEYIARMDADDISLPNRFREQVNYLDQHPQVGVIGSWYQWMDVNGIAGKVVRFPSLNGVIKWHLVVEQQPLAHPLVMMRRAALKAINGYADFGYSQDYDLFRRLSTSCEFYNLPMVLLMRREHRARIGISHSAEQLNNAAHTRQEMMRALLGEEIPLALVSESFPLRSAYVNDLPVLQLTERLYEAFQAVHPLTNVECKEIRQHLAGSMLRIALHHPGQQRKIIIKACWMDPGQVPNLIKHMDLEGQLPSWVYHSLQCTWHLYRRVVDFIQRKVL